MIKGTSLKGTLLKGTLYLGTLLREASAAVTGWVASALKTDDKTFDDTENWVD